MHDLITWSNFEKYQNNSLLNNLVSPSWKCILKLGNLRSFSRIPQKWRLQRPPKVGSICQWDTQLLPSMSHACMVFHSNPCNFEIKIWNEKKMKYFLKDYIIIYSVFKIKRFIPYFGHNKCSRRSDIVLTSIWTTPGTG